MRKRGVGHSAPFSLRLPFVVSGSLFCAPGMGAHLRVQPGKRVAVGQDLARFRKLCGDLEPRINETRTK